MNKKQLEKYLINKKLADDFCITETETEGQFLITGMISNEIEKHFQVQIEDENGLLIETF